MPPSEQRDRMTEMKRRSADFSEMRKEKWPNCGSKCVSEMGDDVGKDDERLRQEKLGGDRLDDAQVTFEQSPDVR